MFPLCLFLCWIGLILDEEVIPCIWPRSVKVVGGTVVEAKGGKKSVPSKTKGKK